MYLIEIFLPSTAARFAIVSPVLPTGKVDLKFNFIKSGMLKGILSPVRSTRWSST